MKKDELILIVDDNLGFVDRIVSMLEESVSRNNINIASNFDEAKRIFFREDHRVVLLDINLPGKNGIDLLRLFKESKKETEIIMITNHADPYYRQQCLDLGAEHFLDKSHDFTLLPGIIRKKLAG